MCVLCIIGDPLSFRAGDGLSFERERGMHSCSGRLRQGDPVNKGLRCFSKLVNVE